MREQKLKISFNSPVILGFAVICFGALILGVITGGRTNNMFFSVYRSSLLDPLTYVRFVGHVFGHAGWEHFLGNIMLILVVGPLLEEKYGSADLLFVILATALVTGIANFALFPRIQLLGASGVVFALILLSSFTSMKEGEIPLTFIMVAALYAFGVSSVKEFALPLMAGILCGTYSSVCITGALWLVLRKVFPQKKTA